MMKHNEAIRRTIFFMAKFSLGFLLEPVEPEFVKAFTAYSVDATKVSHSRAESYRMFMRAGKR